MSEWIEDATSKPRAYWVARVQQLIQENSEPNPDNPQHPETDAGAFLLQLVAEVLESAPLSSWQTGVPPYDGNMRAAAILGYVLSLWFARIARAKLYDPNRPLGNALPIYKSRYLAWCHALAAALFDESEDSTYFPGQKWQYPFAPGAKGGFFV